MFIVLEDGFLLQYRAEPLFLLPNGKVPERSNGTVSKTVVWATVPRVRIPPFPQGLFVCTNRLFYVCQKGSSILVNSLS